MRALALLALFVSLGLRLDCIEPQSGSCPPVEPVCRGFREEPCCRCNDINHCEWLCCVKDDHAR